MNRKIKIGIVIAIVLICSFFFYYYFIDCNHAEKTATDLINGTENVSVIKVDSGLFLDGPGNDTALIFYPGAKVEYISYLPMLMNISASGVDCYLVQMPFNFALLGQNEADAIINNTNYSHYVLSGHSVGGIAAASYAANADKVDGVILLSAYPNVNLTKPVLSIYGSQDKVLNIETYNESKALMANLTEFVIEGGNHEQFAYYGEQSGDGIATISPESQQKQAVDKIIEFINSLK